MSKFEIELSPALSDFVQRQVEAGLYKSAQDVVEEAVRRAALEDWVEADAKTEALRAALQEGLADIEAGRVFECSVDDIIAEARTTAARK